LLNDQRVIAKTSKEIKSFLDANKNQNTTYQNLWYTAKAVLRGKLIAISAYIKRTERSQINDLEKQEHVKFKTSRRREIIKIRAKMNEIETKIKSKQKADCLKK
jgi:hypothetical protein